jgi:hypothetical protein
MAKDPVKEAEGTAPGFGSSTKAGKQRRYYIFLFDKEDEE